MTLAPRFLRTERVGQLTGSTGPGWPLTRDRTGWPLINDSGRWG